MIVLPSGTSHCSDVLCPGTIGMERTWDRRGLFLIPQPGCFGREKFDGVRLMPAYSSLLAGLLRAISQGTRQLRGYGFLSRCAPRVSVAEFVNLCAAYATASGILSKWDRAYARGAAEQLALNARNSCCRPGKSRVWACSPSQETVWIRWMGRGRLGA
jgi:hypothetical protein